MRKTILLLFAICLCLSCSGSGTEQEFIERTVLVYMAADNNLHKQAQKDIEEMLAAEIPSEYNLLAYIDIPNDNPRLLKIKKEWTP